MLSKASAAKRFIAEHQFACFIALCVAVASVMTLISLELYRRSGAIKLDMSRPGYEKVRTEVEKSEDDQPFSSSGELNSAAIQDFQRRVKKYQNELKDLGSFDNGNINDDDLGLPDNEPAVTPPDNQAPSAQPVN